MATLLSQKELFAITGFTRTGDLARSLRDQNIAYFFGKGGRIWTTVDLVNKAGGLVVGSPADDVKPYDPAGFG